MTEWRLSSATKFRFEELIMLLDQTPDDSEDYIAITETIKSLPGFPAGLDPETAHILLVVTDTQH